jgi:hypothetical protein
LEGTVLLRCTPPLREVGVAGFEALFDVREFFEETDTFLLRFSYFLRLSAPPLALDTERLTVEWEGLGARPDSTSLTICSSAAVPFIPNKKWS